MHILFYTRIISYNRNIWETRVNKGNFEIDVHVDSKILFVEKPNEGYKIITIIFAVIREKN